MLVRLQTFMKHRLYKLHEKHINTDVYFINSNNNNNKTNSTCTD